MKKPRKVKEKKSELDIVRKYATLIIHRQTTRGHADDKLKGNEVQKTTNKDLWMDTSFFFSVVFQSEMQKMEFLDQFCKKTNVSLEGYNIQIINGVKLAESLGFKITKEVMEKPPSGSLDLRPYVLDNESL